MVYFSALNHPQATATQSAEIGQTRMVRQPGDVESFDMFNQFDWPRKCDRQNAVTNRRHAVPGTRGQICFGVLTHVLPFSYFISLFHNFAKRKTVIRCF